ncbi:MAG: VOC family protein [Casimicrobiaceae bacterium]
MTPQPLIAVEDVAATSLWYQRVLGLHGGHGGPEYEQLLSDGALVLQLHRWDAHEHPHLGRSDIAPYGNGVLLWFHHPDIVFAYDRACAAGATIIEPIKVNPNARHREFWMRDPNGYTVVVAGDHGDCG